MRSLISTLWSIPLPSQDTLLAVTALMSAALVVIIGVAWRLRGPVNAIIQVFMESAEGEQVIAAGMRAYMATDEGRQFIEGVINGKVRREVEKHDSAPPAHYTQFRDYVRLSDFTAAIGSLRDRIDSQTQIVAATRDATEEILRKIDERR